MVDPQNLQLLILNAIDNDVRQAREDEFPCPSSRPLRPRRGKSTRLVTTIVDGLGHLVARRQDYRAECRERYCRDLALQEGSSAGASGPQNLPELAPDFAVLHKLPAICSCQPKIYRLMSGCRPPGSGLEPVGPVHRFSAPAAPRSGQAELPFRAVNVLPWSQSRNVWIGCQPEPARAGKRSAAISRSRRSR